MHTYTDEIVVERLQLCLPWLPLRGHEMMPLDELALDSIDTVELLCVIHQEFGVRLLERDLAPGRTLREVCAIIAARAGKAVQP